MTKDEKLAGLGWFGLVGIFARSTRPFDMAFALGFPALLYGFYLLLGRIQPSRWLERDDAREIVSRTPTKMRTMRLGWAIVYGLLLPIHILFPIYLRYIGSAPVDAWGLTGFGYLLFCLPMGLFILEAGPRRLRLFPRRREYLLTQGFPLLARTRCGTMQGAEFYVVGSLRCYQVMFQAPGWRKGLLVENYTSESLAMFYAQLFAERFGVSVR